MRNLLFFFLLLLTGCASFLKTQDTIAVELAGNDFTAAQATAQKADYGKKNELLCLLDKGYTYHVSADYGSSVDAFLQARRKFDDVYAKSITQTAASLALNDYSLEYSGEDYERILLNVFQMLNYLSLGRAEDAMVEARDGDSALKAIGGQYKGGEKNAYKDDAFMRFLSGIAFESSGNRQDIEDAKVFYRQAQKLYDDGYYGVRTPRILNEKLRSNHDRNKAQVYLIHYAGAAPSKEEVMLPVPIPGDQRIISLAFAQYPPTIFVPMLMGFRAVDDTGFGFTAMSEMVENVDALAREALERRKAKAIAKTILKNAARYAIEEKSSDMINEKYGSNAAAAFDIASAIYNVLAERADLRSWRLLPSQINAAYLELKPGHYKFYSNSGGNETLLNDMDLKAGDVRFIIVSTRS